MRIIKKNFGAQSCYCLLHDDINMLAFISGFYLFLNGFEPKWAYCIEYKLKDRVVAR